MGVCSYRTRRYDMEEKIQAKRESTKEAQEILQGEVLTSTEVETEIRKDYKRQYIN